MLSTLGPSALEFATRSHASQRRASDGAPFIEHPLEVSRLLRHAGCSEEVVAAGLLHDIVEDTTVSLDELTSRFGPVVSGLVGAVSDDEAIEGYRERKQALRDQVRDAGSDAAVLFAADKISKVRELRASIARARAPSGQPEAPLDAQRLRLEHYQRSLAMLRGVAPRHPLVAGLATELAQTRRAIRVAASGRTSRRPSRARRRAGDGRPVGSTSATS